MGRGHAVPRAISGKVLEVKDVESYTYLRLKTKDGEIWAAVNKAPVKVGADVTIDNPTVMTNFESKTLKKTFDRIVFGSLAAPGASASSKDADMAALHAGMTKPVDVGDVKVAKAAGPDARTVAEVNTQKGRPQGQAGRGARQGREVHARRDGQELDPPARRIGCRSGRQQRHRRDDAGRDEDRRRRAGEGRRCTPTATSGPATRTRC